MRTFLFPSRAAPQIPTSSTNAGRHGHVGSPGVPAGSARHRAVNHHYLGDQVRALDSVGGRHTPSHKSGELLHVPNLLRLRAEITVAGHPDRTEDVIADLVAAIELGLDTGSLMLALRAANTLAGLPEAVRPGNWREVVQALSIASLRIQGALELAIALSLLAGLTRARQPIPNQLARSGKRY